MFHASEKIPLLTIVLLYYLIIKIVKEFIKNDLNITI